MTEGEGRSIRYRFVPWVAARMPSGWTARGLST